jgi:hypothetical protein
MTDYPLVVLVLRFSTFSTPFFPGVSLKNTQQQMLRQGSPELAEGLSTSGITIYQENHRSP